MRSLKLNTKLAVYIKRHHSTIKNFTIELNKWAGMEVYKKEGCTALCGYVAGTSTPRRKISFTKLGIVFDFIAHKTGEMPDLSWIAPFDQDEEQTQKSQELPLVFLEQKQALLIDEVHEAFMKFSERIDEIFNNYKKTN